MTAILCKAVPLACKRELTTLKFKVIFYLVTEVYSVHSKDKPTSHHPVELLIGLSSIDCIHKCVKTASISPALSTGVYLTFIT